MLRLLDHRRFSVRGLFRTMDEDSDSEIRAFGFGFGFDFAGGFGFVFWESPHPSFAGLRFAAQVQVIYIHALGQ